MLVTLRAFAESLFANGDTPPPAARLDWVMAEMEDYLIRAGSRARLVFRASLFAVSAVAPLFVGSLAPLHRLDVARRVKALHAMEASFASAPILAVKAFLCVVWYEHPEVQQSVGYQGFGRSGLLASPASGGRS
jgi:hypothetical protein